MQCSRKCVSLLGPCFNFAHFLASFNIAFGCFHHLCFLLHSLVLKTGFSMDGRCCVYCLDSFQKLHDHFLYFVFDFKFGLVMIRKHSSHVLSEVCSLVQSMFYFDSIPWLTDDVHSWVGCPTKINWEEKVGSIFGDFFLMIDFLCSY